MRENLVNYNSKEIHCPKCNKRLGNYDGKETDMKFYQFHCVNCNVRVLYDLKEEKTETRPSPFKITAHGLEYV